MRTKTKIRQFDGNEIKIACILVLISSKVILWRSTMCLQTTASTALQFDNSLAVCSCQPSWFGLGVINSWAWDSFWCGLNKFDKSNCYDAYNSRCSAASTKHFYKARVSSDLAVTKVHLQSPHSSYASNAGIHTRMHLCRFTSWNECIKL